MLKNEAFYRTGRVPVHSVLLFRSRREAVECPKADIELQVCGECGFIANVSFDEALLTYSQQYESTQTYSGTFVDFQKRLAASLVAKYDLVGKNIVEIGCGNGEFLSLLCDLGGNRGVGYDPAAQESRRPAVSRGEMQIVPERYSDQTRIHDANLVCCMMTLEHIPGVLDFLKMIRRSLGGESDATILFQVPNIRRILHETAFWDIYYEHCSYFSPGSLSGVVRRSGFAVTDLWTEYDGQYMMLEAATAEHPGGRYREREEDPKELIDAAKAFADRVGDLIRGWEERLLGSLRAGKKLVLWGSGSKAVAFLTKLSPDFPIEHIVDINPHKWGTYSAGTGQQIVSPDFLKGYRPDVVVAMNPFYVKEISASLRGLGVEAELIHLS